jgi:serine/threonine protein kinase
MYAMSYYHALNISHRDIKLENILVDMNSDELFTKVIDFGFATQTTTSNELIKTCCGTPSYMAPELCLKEEYIGPAVDIWAAGVVLYTLLLGVQPWKGKTEDDLFRKIQKGAIVFPKS